MAKQSKKLTNLERILNEKADKLNKINEETSEIKDITGRIEARVCNNAQSVQKVFFWSSLVFVIVFAIITSIFFQSEQYAIGTVFFSLAALLLAFSMFYITIYGETLFPKFYKSPTNSLVIKERIKNKRTNEYVPVVKYVTIGGLIMILILIFPTYQEYQNAINQSIAQFENFLSWNNIQHVEGTFNETVYYYSNASIYLNISPESLLNEKIATVGKKVHINTMISFSTDKPDLTRYQIFLLAVPPSYPYKNYLCKENFKEDFMFRQLAYWGEEKEIQKKLDLTFVFPLEGTWRLHACLNEDYANNISIMFDFPDTGLPLQVISIKDANELHYARNNLEYSSKANVFVLISIAIAIFVFLMNLIYKYPDY